MSNKYHFYLEPGRTGGEADKSVIQMVKVVGADNKNVHTTTVACYTAGVKDTPEEAAFAAAFADWREHVGLGDAKSGVALVKNLKRLEAQHAEAIQSAAHHQAVADGLIEKLQAARAIAQATGSDAE